MSLAFESTGWENRSDRELVFIDEFAPSPLPSTDAKPPGSADFYFAVNATFRFRWRRVGPDGWRRYLADMGCGYFAPVNRQ
jgi:hypothetical protein